MHDFLVKHIVPRIYWLYRLYLRVWRPRTLGCRALVIKDGKVLLVRMTYVKDWYLPGGGVKRGETFRAAMIRELREECAIQAESIELYGAYLSRKDGAVDHVLMYLVERFSEIPGAKPDAEIRDIGFFPLNALPDGAAPSTRRRVQEYLAGRRDVDEW